MNSATPWIGTVSALLGVVLTVGATQLRARSDRRTERSRLSREQKTADYPELLRAARTLLRLPVFPVEDGDPRPELAAVESAALRVTLFAPREMAALAEELAAAAVRLADTVRELRASTLPGREPDGAEQARTELERVLTEFTEAARRDLEAEPRRLR
ncbi:hypothetical protein [Sciscionella marina]|uniref:hypothetical protein n=1 Tax=Sciscionella marina TaxID=508770 RepID=UPI0003691351|nr:hypothetical protein [Sciscionella marina]